MLKVVSVKGAYAPRIYCDQCGQAIDDAFGANVVYHDDRAEDGESPKFSHVHKGNCDRLITAKLGDRGGTDELVPHLAYLLNNVGLPWPRIKRGFETIAALAGMDPETSLAESERAAEQADADAAKRVLDDLIEKGEL